MLQILQKAACDAAFCRALGRSTPQTGLNMFQYDEQVWTKGGQQLQEFWNSAELHLKARNHSLLLLLHVKESLLERCLFD
jgi:hypothetical protein